ncbi:MAG: YcgL domain-containing protein [Pseudomonadota bacterium]
MECWIYRGKKQPDAYLFIPREGDFEAVPQALLDRMGELELAMNIELTPGRKLARSNPEIVREALSTQGFFLQPPPPKTPLLRNDRL